MRAPLGNLETYLLHLCLYKAFSRALRIRSNAAAPDRILILVMLSDLFTCVLYGAISALQGDGKTSKGAATVMHCAVIIRIQKTMNTLRI